ncbi:MAG: hypothetical protein ACI87W_003379 [Halieaceae bacterium]|jgi:hypothetical protein
MRENRQLIDTDAIPWEPLSAVLQRKVLNGCPDEGPHTLLLRSQARDPGPAFAQYHSIDEELYCLDGDFSFDGSTWFRGGSYAFYPAYFVHGANVHVRGGYLLYLRLSGVSELFKVDEPASAVPYYVGEGDATDYALQLTDAGSSQAISAVDDAGTVQLTPLHRDAITGKGSTILSTTSAGAVRTIEFETSGLLEVFTVSGRFGLAGGGHLKTHSYHCEVGERPRVTLECEQGGSLMISHEGELRVTERDAASSSG